METAVFCSQTDACPEYTVVANHDLDHARLLVGVHPDRRCVDLSPTGHVAVDGSTRVVRHPMHPVGRLLVFVRGVQSRDAGLALRESPARFIVAPARIRHRVRHDHAGVVPDVRVAAEPRISGGPGYRSIRWGRGALIASVVVGVVVCLRAAVHAPAPARLLVGVRLDGLVLPPGTVQLLARRAQHLPRLATRRPVAHAAVVRRRRDLRLAVGVLEHVGLHQVGLYLPASART